MAREKGRKAAGKDRLRGRKRGREDNVVIDDMDSSICEIRKSRFLPL